MESLNKTITHKIAIRNISDSDWISDIRRHTEELDFKLRAIIQENQLAVALGALGVGLVASIIVGKVSSQKERL